MSGVFKWIVGGAAFLYLWNKITTVSALLKTNVQVVDFRFKSIKFDYTTVEITFRLENFSKSRVVLNFLRFALYINGSYAGYMSQSLNNTILNSYGSAIVSCSINLRTSTLLSVLTSYLVSGDDKYLINVRLNGSVGLSGTSYDFTPVFKVSIPTLSSLVDKIKSLFDKEDKDTDVAPSVEEVEVVEEDVV